MKNLKLNGLRALLVALIFVGIYNRVYTKFDISLIIWLVAISLNSILIEILRSPVNKS